MILSDIRDYLKQRRQCTLNDIALHFDANADAVRGMLAVWIKKGKVERRNATASCGTSCQSCDPATTELYFWVEPTEPSAIKVEVPVPGFCNHQ